MKDPVAVQCCQVARRVPTVFEHLGRFFRPIQVALHDIGTFDQQQSGTSYRQWSPGIGIGYAHADAWQRMANPASLLSHLVEAGCSEVTHIHRHDWRALRATIALHGTNAKALLKGCGQPVTELLCTYHDVTQTAKVFGIAAPHIPLQKCGCGEK